MDSEIPELSDEAEEHVKLDNGDEVMYKSVQMLFPCARLCTAAVASVLRFLPDPPWGKGRMGKMYV